jgi:hypothetical protein
MIKYFINYGLLMRRLSLFLAGQHLNSGTNFVSARIRDGSRFLFLCFVLIDVGCLHVSLNIPSRPQAEDHWSSE